MSRIGVFCSAVAIAIVAHATAFAVSEQYRGMIYQVGQLKPIDSVCTLKAGDKAPDFSLPSISGEPVSLSAFAGKKNVVISFVPAAWTPVCSDQWPGYNLLRDMFEARNAVMLGITVDNIPTLFAWTSEMGKVWFPVLSDFWPHGEVAGKYGVLRSNGVSERAIFVIDRQGIIRYIDVHDINERPKMEILMAELDKLNQ
ncbi:MAG: peroxiredoxin [Syntrophobacteraceae bacterium]|jgi:peroxiredoxin (alkyl hydroperoxide reductase subunit C)